MFTNQKKRITKIIFIIFIIFSFFIVKIIFDIRNSQRVNNYFPGTCIQFSTPAGFLWSEIDGCYIDKNKNFIYAEKIGKIYNKSIGLKEAFKRDKETKNVSYLFIKVDNIEILEHNDSQIISYSFFDKDSNLYTICFSNLNGQNLIEFKNKCRSIIKTIKLKNIIFLPFDIKLKNKFVLNIYKNQNKFGYRYIENISVKKTNGQSNSSKGKSIIIRGPYNRKYAPYKEEIYRKFRMGLIKPGKVKDIEIDGFENPVCLDSKVIKKNNITFLIFKFKGISKKTGVENLIYDIIALGNKSFYLINFYKFEESFESIEKILNSFTPKTIINNNYKYIIFYLIIIILLLFLIIIFLVKLNKIKGIKNWNCLKCGNENPLDHYQCWKCGNENPHRVKTKI